LNNRRSRLEIINNILILSKNGAKKTEILYKGNFSYARLTAYLNYLINRDILEEKTINDNGSSYKYYIITQKGIDLLGNIDKTLSFLQK